jgi:hypothetical protein
MINLVVRKRSSRVALVAGAIAACLIVSDAVSQASAQGVGRSRSNLTGTYQLNTSQSDDSSAIADRVTRSLPARDRTRLRTQILQRLESLHSSGIQQLSRGTGVSPALTSPSSPDEGLQATDTAHASRPSAEPQTPSPPSHSHPSTPVPSHSMALLTAPYPANLPTSLSDRQDLLETLNSEVRACTLCRELACTRKQTVFGVGPIRETATVRRCARTGRSGCSCHRARAPELFRLAPDAASTPYGTD